MKYSVLQILQNLERLYSKNSTKEEIDNYLESLSTEGFVEVRGQLETEITQARDKGETPSANALFILGTFYFKARGVEKDQAKARDLFEEAAKQNHLYAISNLAACLLINPSSDEDLYKAAELFGQAAKKGCAVAASNLAILYCEGKAVTQNIDNAISLFGQAAEKGDTESIGHLLTLANFYKEENKTTPSEQNLSRASQCATLAYMHSAEGSPVKEEADALIKRLVEVPGNLAETTASAAQKTDAKQQKCD